MTELQCFIIVAGGGGGWSRSVYLNSVRLANNLLPFVFARINISALENMVYAFDRDLLYFQQKTSANGKWSGIIISK
jgi:hypothetical protein